MSEVDALRLGYQIGQALPLVIGLLVVAVLVRATRRPRKPANAGIVEEV